jgi:electron transport complex protein RnfC
MYEVTPDRRVTGGVRIDAHKDKSTERPIKRGFIPSQLILGLQQHQGSAATPVVRPGERVLKGQLLARSASLRSANVHASTSGTVRSIENRLIPAAHEIHRSQCIVIDTDGVDEAIQAQSRAPWPKDPLERLERIRDGGIVGLGGAVFPTASKLAIETNCKALIVNAVECEPYISCDDMLMRESPREIIEGALLLRDVLGAPECIIAIEEDKSKAIAALTEAAREVEHGSLKLAEIPTIYPSGGERQLIELLLGHEVPSTQYPSMTGYICQNVGTVFALRALIVNGEPLIKRIVTVTGNGVVEPCNVETLIGTPIAELIEFCGGYREGVNRLVLGGSMMGYALPGDELPITKASNCLIAAVDVELRRDYSEWPCIRCGDCGTACPARLLPQELLRAARSRNHAMLSDLGLEDCIECGCCDVVCPSHIPLTEEFRNAKSLHARYERQQVLSAESDQRFQRREQRQRSETDRSQHLQEDLKQELAQDGDSASKAIAAAVERAKNKRAKKQDRSEQ